jgi:hypothetical protein
MNKDKKKRKKRSLGEVLREKREKYFMVRYSCAMVCC